MMISRRAALAAALAASTVTRAKAAGKPWRIGWLDGADVGADRQAPLVRALKDMGYAEGRDFVVEDRHASGQSSQLPALAADLVRHKADVIVAYGDRAVGAAKEATSTIPIVMLSSTDPVGLGFVASLNRPGGNITGISSIAADLAAKQLDFLKQAVPRLNRVMVLTNARGSGNERASRSVAEAAQTLHLSLTIEQAPNLPAAQRVFAAMADHRPDGIVVFSEGLDGTTRIGIAKLALQQKIPLICDTVFMIAWGALISYQASYASQASRAAWYAEKILKGARPGELPVEEPTEIRLTINLETAKAIGVTIPQSLLLRADHIIE